VRNGNDAISMIQTVDGAMVEVTNMLQRMREVTVQAASGTNTTDDLAALNIEFKALEAQIDEIAKNTEWNGTKVLDGSAGSVTFQVGASASQTISIEFADLNTDFGNPAANSGADQATKAGKTDKAADDLDIFTNLSTANASTDTVTTDGVLEAIDLDVQVITGSAHATTLGYLDTALDRINSHRATLGATVNRLEYAVDNLANVSQNASASRSRVQDANYATESTELARTQIIQQAGTAMLAQANQQSQSVLALLK
jgi:flagellin